MASSTYTLSFRRLEASFSASSRRSTGFGSGADWITDFSSADGDRVQLQAGTAFVLRNHEGQVLIDLGGGDQLGLAGVAAGALGDWLVYA
jgi:hypothetical protein